jgi:FkbM family methyltransferase
VVTQPALMFREGTNDLDIWKKQGTEYRGLPYENAIVLDVGCHAGFFARYALLHGAKHVTSFEPHPENYNQAAIHLAGMESKLYKAAVTSHSGTVKLYSNQGSNKGSHSLRIEGGRTSMDVSAISFEEALAKEPFTVVKVDIEGGEYDLDMTLLPSSVNHIAMELHLNKKKWRSSDAPRMIETIEGLGFTPIKIPKIGDKNWYTQGVWSRS